jgi:histidinol-phosphate aminotransferase
VVAAQARVIAIAGATRGIGLELAGRLAAAGDRLVINGRDETAVGAVAARFGAVGVAADVGTIAGAAALIDGALERCGRLDAMVVCAGDRGPAVDLVDLDPADWERVVATNLNGAFALCRRFLRAAPAGRIVLLSSWAAARAEPRSSAYAATKRAVEGLVDAVAAEVSGQVICAVRPRGGGEGAASLIAAVLDAPARQVHGRVIDRLDASPAREPGPTGGSPWGVSPRVREALIRASERPSFEYPGVSAGQLVAAIARHLGIADDRVVLGAGATELCDRILATLLRPGDSVVVTDPEWPGLPRLLARNRLRDIAVPYAIDLAAHRASIDPRPLIAAIDPRTRAVLLSSPHNPLGPALTAAELEAIAGALPDGVALVVDETYRGFAPDAADAASYPRAIAVRSFSKLDGLAGLRVGYAVAEPSIAARLDAAGLPAGVNHFACVAAREAIADRAFREHVRAGNARERERIIARLPQGLRWLRSDASFVSIAVPDPRRFVAACAAAGLPVAAALHTEHELVALPVGLPEQNDRRLEILEQHAKERRR